MLNKPFRYLVFSFFLIFCFGSGQAQETERVLIYRVQFAASKTFIQPSYFQKKHNLEDSVQYFEKDGFYKYYVGDFDTEAIATEYYHKTGDVGYVISMVVDKQIVVEQDTIQEQIEHDTTIIVPEDTVKLDATSQSNENINKELTDFQKMLIGLGLFLLVIIIVMIIWSSIRSKKKASKKLTIKEFEEFNESDKFDELDDNEELDENYENDDKNEEDTIVDDDIILLDEDEDNDGDEEIRENPFVALYQPENDLSGWDQLRMLDTIKNGKIDPPDFSSWLDSQNSTIIAFCLRMIRSLKQENAYQAVARLLHHKKDDIRAEAIVTLGMLGNKEAHGLFRERFEGETLTNRMLILRSMARMPDESNIEFLKQLVKVPGNLQIEASNALASIETVGIAGVEEFLEVHGISSETIARHILINKL